MDARAVYAYVLCGLPMRLLVQWNPFNLHVFLTERDGKMFTQLSKRALRLLNWQLSVCHVVIEPLCI